MRELSIRANEAGQRFDKFLSKYMRKAPKSFFYKMLRKKNITLNGKKATGQEILSEGDCVKLFLSDETIENFSEKMTAATSDSKHKSRRPRSNVKLDILYEDDDLLFINKPVGMLSQKAKDTDCSVVEYLIDYLLRTHAITEEQLRTFRPAACNRLDRNTSGIVACGKSLMALQTLSEMFRDRTIEKYYLCLVKGVVKKKRKIDGYLAKEERTNQVTVIDEQSYLNCNNKKDYTHIETEYEAVCSSSDLTLLKVHLITGKTHQIRAHLAYEGHPIVGDPKYGDPVFNKRFQKEFGLNHQLLHAYLLRFPVSDGESDTSLNKKMSGMEITAPLPELFEKICIDKGVLHHGDMEFKRS